MSETIIIIMQALTIEITTMGVVFILYKLTDKASWVDTAWAGGIGVIAFFFATRSGSTPLAALILAVMVALYSFRLGMYLFVRTIQNPEDGRYLNIQNNWKSNLNLKFFLFYQFQGILVIILAVPVLLVALDPKATFQGLQFIALGIFIIGLVGESTADNQLRKFKQEETNKGKVCDKGLWRYSRHPNYFFDFLIWCSFALFASSSPYGIFTFGLPLMMLYFFLFVTGIPETEKQALKSKGELYAQYQKNTSPFIPWFPGKNKTKLMNVAFLEE